MSNESCLVLVEKSQKGDSVSRELLINNSANFILKTASLSCRRCLDWANDDELSVALLAFNEAIDNYDFKKQNSFFTYARMVMQRRLIDYFRREGKQTHVPLETDTGNITGGKEKSTYNLEARISLSVFFKEQDNAERKDEIRLYSRMLNDYGLNFDVLETKCPRHRETRKKLYDTAAVLVDKQSLLRHLTKKKQLPLKELRSITGNSFRVLSRGRVYIIAVALILNNPELVYLRNYIKKSHLNNFPGQEREVKGNG